MPARQNREQQVQKAIVRALEAALPRGWLVHHSANRPRSMIAGAIEKSMGAKAGFPDLVIVGRLDERPYAGYMEVKTKGGRLSDVQLVIRDRLMDAGFDYAVVRSVDDALLAAQSFGLPLRARVAA